MPPRYVPNIRVAIGQPSVVEIPGDSLEFELVDETGRPMAGLRYLVRPSGGAEREGRLDDAGRARVEGIPSAECVVRFPDLEATVRQVN